MEAMFCRYGSVVAEGMFCRDGGELRDVLQGWQMGEMSCIEGRGVTAKMFCRNRG